MYPRIVQSIADLMQVYDIGNTYLLRKITHFLLRQCFFCSVDWANLQRIDHHCAETYLVVRIEDMHIVRLQAFAVQKRAILASQVAQQKMSVGIRNLGVAA